MDELCELVEFVAAVEPSPDEMAVLRRGPERSVRLTGSAGARPSRSVL
jgi:hypothetical protein